MASEGGHDGPSVRNRPLPDTRRPPSAPALSRAGCPPQRHDDERTNANEDGAGAGMRRAAAPQPGERLSQGAGDRTTGDGLLDYEAAARYLCTTTRHVRELWQGGSLPPSRSAARSGSPRPTSTPSLPPTGYAPSGDWRHSKQHRATSSPALRAKPWIAEAEATEGAGQRGHSSLFGRVPPV